MNDRSRLIAARILATLAVVSLPGFVWIGWRQLLVSVVLSAVAALLAPGDDDGRLNPSRRSRLYRSLRQRLSRRNRRRF